MPISTLIFIGIVTWAEALQLGSGAPPSSRLRMPGGSHEVGRAGDDSSSASAWRVPHRLPSLPRISLIMSSRSASARLRSLTSRSRL